MHQQIDSHIFWKSFYTYYHVIKSNSSASTLAYRKYHRAYFYLVFWSWYSSENFIGYSTHHDHMFNAVLQQSDEQIATP